MGGIKESSAEIFRVFYRMTYCRILVLSLLIRGITVSIYLTLRILVWIMWQLFRTIGTATVVLPRVVLAVEI